MRLANVMALVRQYWKPSGQVRTVLDGYRALGETYKLTLSDIALRNSVFRYDPPGADVFDRGVAEGRRQAALEIFMLAEIDGALLYPLIDHKSDNGGKR